MTTAADYDTHFASADGWEYEHPTEGEGRGDLKDGQLHASAGRWWSPHLQLQPFGIYRVTFTGDATRQLYWAAKHFDTDGKMLDADHYSDFIPNGAPQAYTSFFRVPHGAATSRILFDGNNGTGYSFTQLSIAPAQLGELNDWWEQLTAHLPDLDYQPPADRWQALPRTRGVLEEGGRLRLVMLGDSIINDTANSVFELPLIVNQGVQWEVASSVRGSTGCGYYVDHLDEYVHRYQPTLVNIGGRSQTADLEQIEQVVELLAPKYDVLLTSNGFPKVTDEDGTEWQSHFPPQPGDYSDSLAQIAKRHNVGFLDFEGVLHHYVDSHGLDAGDFLRDPVHTGDLGRAVYAHILQRYYSL